MSCPSATFALQYGGFVPPEWLYDGKMLPAIGEDNNGDATDQDFCRSITNECDHLESDFSVHHEPLYEGSDSDCSEYEYESVPLVEILNRYCLNVK